MNARDDQPRVPKGAMGAGRFDAIHGAESGLSLNLPPGGLLIREGLFESLSIPSDLSDLELAAVTDPDQAPVSVRVMAAATPYAGVAARAAADPHPLVRAIAYTSPQLEPMTAALLERDPEVCRALDLVVGTDFRDRSASAVPV